MPLNCAADCRFCEFERVHDDAASPSQKEDDACTEEKDVIGLTYVDVNMNSAVHVGEQSIHCSSYVLSIA